MDEIQRSLEAAKMLAEQLGYWPSSRQWDKYAKENGFMTAGAIRYRTGKNWEDFRKEYGFSRKIREWTAEECIQALQQAAEELGEFFTKREYEAWQNSKKNAPTATQISRKFAGSFNNAKRAAGLLLNEPWGKFFSDTEILDALRECSKVYGSLFSEKDYEKWREDFPDAPNIETIRSRFGGVPEAKKILGLDYYEPSGYAKFDNGRWEDYFLRFLAHALNIENYKTWAKENDGPSINALADNAGGYEQALLAMLPKYIEKIKAGRKKR